eukprot:2814752-Prorocentrum_lima.AAC.1
MSAGSGNEGCAGGGALHQWHVSCLDQLSSEQKRAVPIGGRGQRSGAAAPTEAEVPKSCRESN